YDRGTGVPLIMRWPAKIPAATTLDAMLNTIDIMPTLLDAAQEQIPGQVQGKSFLDLATGRRQGEIHEAVFTEMTYHVHYLPTRAARMRKWKYIRNYSDIAKGLDQNSHMEWAHRLCERPNQPWKKPREPEELYDLVSDPHEQTNLSADGGHTAVLDSMRKLLDNHMRRTNDPYLGKPFTRDFDPNLYTRHTAGEKYN
ncbi:MAG: hypothetical protein JW920_05805, partial [Deltaproteobacteria bacterium]|nr:hypothetical protein [Deltaproteobacteria bacterium]